MAKLFATSLKQVTNYIQRKKFDPNDLESIFNYYANTKDAVDRRQKQWKELFLKYNTHVFRQNSPERIFVEENLRDWGRTSEILKW